MPSKKTVYPNTGPLSERFAADLPTRDPTELYRALVESSPDGILMVNLSGRIVYASRAALTLFEMEAVDQAVGSQMLAWVAVEDRARVSENLQAAERAILTKDNQYHFLTAQGHRFIGEIKVAPLHAADGSTAGLLATVRDVTDRFYANEALALSENKLRRVLEATPQGMHFYRLEAGGRLVLEDYNPAADRILGINHIDRIGRSIEEAFPGLSATQLPAVFRRLAAEGGQWQAEQTIHRDRAVSGTYEVVAFQSLPGRVVVSFSDVSRRKQAEEELRYSEAQLRAGQEMMRQIAIDLHESNDALRNSIAHEQLLRTLDKLIIENEGIQASVEALLRPIIEFFQADAIEILSYRPESQTFFQIAGIGFISDQYRLPINAMDGIAGMALRARRTICLPDLFNGEMQVFNSQFFVCEKFTSGYAALLETPGRIHGVLQLFYRAPLELSHDRASFFEMVAGQAAIALQKASLWENHQKALSELVEAYASTLEGWVYALDLRDKETEDHTYRVTGLTIAVAEAMGIGSDQLADLRRGALLHDIGKIGIPDAILHKPGPLSPSEWVVMHKHPQFAKDMLEPIAYLRGAIDIPYCHHERWDGSGYPRGLRGEEIPLSARIFAVVDVWDALTSDRVYRKAWPVEQAAAYLLDNAGVQFDPRAIQAFFKVVEN